MSEGRRESMMERILKSCVPIEETGCLCWTGPNSGSGRGGGYPRMSLDGQTVAVHRVVATNVFGYIPRSRQVDHKCRNRMCVNPDHLEVVPHKINMKRRDQAQAELKGKLK